jgi:hypothetical protein
MAYLLDVFEFRSPKVIITFSNPAVDTANCAPAVPLAALAAGKVVIVHRLFTTGETAVVSISHPVAIPVPLAAVPPTYEAVPVPMYGVSVKAVPEVLKVHCVTTAADAVPEIATTTDVTKSDESDFMYETPKGFEVRDQIANGCSPRVGNRRNVLSYM